MRSFIYALILLGLLASVGAAAEPALLPDRIGPWQADGPAKVTSSNALYAIPSDVLTTALREAELQSIEQRNYTNENQHLNLRVLVFKDPTGAYEVYTQALDPSMKNVRMGEEAAFDQYHAIVLIGNMVLIAGPSPNLKLESISGLDAALKAKADRTPYPPLKSYLPMKWRVWGSEKYALGLDGFEHAMEVSGLGAYAGLGKEVGFQFGAEAILAKYQGEYGSGILLLLQYPNPQLAEQHLHHLEEVLPVAAKKAGVTVERKASLLSLVFEPTSAMHAQAIRDEVNYETEVTWNEPHQTATDPSMASMMVKIFLFTGLFMGVATAVGVAFGGMRVIIKRLYPGKVFDRPQDIEVLQLGLSGKKIDPSDMY